MAEQQDTLQETLNEVIEPSTTVEDAFSFPMQTNEDSGQEAADIPKDDVFVEQNEQTSQEEAPVTEEEVPSNDEKRFQYWQSQADKYKNQVEQQESEMNRLRTMPPQEPATPVQAKKEEFPPPPRKPQRPSGFSREEAYTDPSSESAKHLDAIETWRDNIDEYRDLKNQYDNAVVQERFEAEDERRKQQDIQRQQYDAANAQKKEAYEHVQGHYGMNPEDAREFVETMSKPESLSMDNLVALYRIQKGQGAQPVQNAPVQPSPAFTQTKNAQQVPSPMGVQPSSNNEVDGRNEEDKIFDNLISDYKSRNPF
tara:strand:- start:11590 stop:12522 length:933 start_codon:yes stop_codon:yes gene_type:complete